MKNIKIYENHTIINSTWKKIILRSIPAMIVSSLILVGMVITAVLYIISLGHICLIRRVNNLSDYWMQKVFDDPELEDTLQNNKIFDKVGFATKNWREGMGRILIMFLLAVPLTLGYALSGIIWFISIGHLHFYRLMNYFIEILPVPFDTDETIVQENPT